MSHSFVTGVPRHEAPTFTMFMLLIDKGEAGKRKQKPHNPSDTWQILKS